MKRAVESGYWPLYRFDPRRAAAGESPLKLDSPPPRGDLVDLMRRETRFRVVEQQDPARFAELARQAQEGVVARYALYEQLARAMTPGQPGARP